MLSWKYIVASPTTNTITPWPAQWKKELVMDNIADRTRFLGISSRYISSAIQRLKLAFSFRQFLTSHLSSSKENVIFIEYFDVKDLKALYLCLCSMVNKNFTFWLMLRVDPSYYSDPDGIIKWHKKLVSLLGKKRMRLLAETEELISVWHPILESSISIVPVPFVSESLPASFPRNDKRILCWWPGSNLFHGSTTIRELITSQDKCSHKLSLLFSERATMDISNATLDFKILPKVLCRDDYLKWMATCDVLLQPYLPDKYLCNVSGTFMEAVCAGKIPIVSPHTTQARELHKYDLQDLVIDWTRPDLPSIIVEKAKDPSIQKRLSAMQKDYCQQHNVSTFAKAMEKLQTGLA